MIFGIGIESTNAEWSRPEKRLPRQCAIGLEAASNVMKSRSTNPVFVAAILLWGCGKSCAPFATRLRTSTIPFSDLASDQQSLFKTYRPAEDPRKVWDELQDLSKQVEFAAGTRALEQACGLPKCVDSLKDIHGDLGNSSLSVNQFNVEVNWTQAALSLEQLPGWSDHLAVLHQNQFGYEENRDGNPFLGLVVLFDEKHPLDKIPGQFHIGFRSWFAHYNRVNGNIGDYFNYECYCEWYGQFDGFKPASGASPLAMASLDTNQMAGAGKSDLMDSVEDFLEAWFVRRNYS